MLVTTEPPAPRQRPVSEHGQRDGRVTINERIEIGAG
jgi:hypothetical protein